MHPTYVLSILLFTVAHTVYVSIRNFVCWRWRGFFTCTNFLVLLVNRMQLSTRANQHPFSPTKTKLYHGKSHHTIQPEHIHNSSKHLLQYSVLIVVSPAYASSRSGPRQPTLFVRLLTNYTFTDIPASAGPERNKNFSRSLLLTSIRAQYHPARPLVSQHNRGPACESCSDNDNFDNADM